MKIFKFGGASIKDSDGLRNMARLIQATGYKDVLIVVSAMGKMTNAFEKISDAFFYKKDELVPLIDNAKAFHYNIASQLFNSKNHTIFLEMESIFLEMTDFMKNCESSDYNYVYDQIVSRAELISTKIVSQFLNDVGINNTWIDVRDFIITNNEYRDARVDWKKTEKKINTRIAPNKLYVTQGFIAKDVQGSTTTLGREGSDYSAGIFAYCLNAESLTIWKDVEGVLSGDPRYFKDVELLEQISYTEAIELAFYGASVIHPKTLQPLQKKEIPLFVKSFVNPENKGTVVTRGTKIIPETPCFIVKKDQILLSISSLDFSFIVEQNISEIFDFLHKYKMKVSLIQNSAISFSVCMEDKYQNIIELLEALKIKFNLEFYKEVTLLTIRHFNEDAIKKIEHNKKVLLKQLTRETVQIVIQ
ncbi:MAG: aspartate kinase [Flavobacteriaceae bacterium]|nr:aspartate kinase [Flavobacteriaceae bacterium]